MKPAIAAVPPGRCPEPDRRALSASRPAPPSPKLVEARRGPLEGAPAGGGVEVRRAPADISRARGPRNPPIRASLAEYRLSDLRVRPDPDLPRGHYALTEAV